MDAHSTIDVPSAHVRGPGVRMSGVRVVWCDGRVYVARGSGTVLWWLAPEPTRLAGGDGWTMGPLTVRRRGCAPCAARRSGRSIEQLVAAARPADGVGASA